MSIVNSNNMTLWHHIFIHAMLKTIRSLHLHPKDVPQVKGNIAPCHRFELGKTRKKPFSSHLEDVSFADDALIVVQFWYRVWHVILVRTDPNGSMRLILTHRKCKWNESSAWFMCKDMHGFVVFPSLMS